MPVGCTDSITLSYAKEDSGWDRAVRKNAEYLAPRSWSYVVHVDGVDEVVSRVRRNGVEAEAKGRPPRSTHRRETPRDASQRA